MGSLFRVRAERGDLMKVFCVVAALCATAWGEDLLSSTDHYGDTTWTPITLAWKMSSETGRWIGLFPFVNGQAPNMSAFACPYVCDAPFTATSPLMFKEVDLLRAESHTFIVPNYRVDLVGGLFSGIDKPELVAQTPVIKAVTPRAFQYLHASIIKAGELMVHFQGPPDAPPAAVLVQQPGGHVAKIPAKCATSYTQKEICNFGPASANGWIDQPTFYTGIIEFKVGAGPITLQAVADESETSSSSSVFASAPAPSPTATIAEPAPPGADATVGIIMTADMGVSGLGGSLVHWDNPAALETMRGMSQLLRDGIAFGGADGPVGGKVGIPEEGERVAVHAAFHNGDIAYATGYLGKWDAFLAAQTTIGVMGNLTYHVGMGNHEEDGPKEGGGVTFYPSVDSGGECGVPTAARFATNVSVIERLSKGGQAQSDVAVNATRTVQGRGVKSEGGDTMPPVYVSRKVIMSTFDDVYVRAVGPVAVVMWNTEMSVAVGSDQFSRLEAVLASIDRRQTPWVVVFGHRPMYSGIERDPYIGTAEALLWKYKVSVSVYGHVHNAQLFCPLSYLGATCLRPHSGGPYVSPIHIVAGNAGMYLSGFAGGRDNRTTYSAFEFGFSSIAANRTHLQWHFYNDGVEGASQSYRFMMTDPLGSGM